MKIEIIKCLKDNYSFLLINEKNNHACVIDPGESKPILDFIENKNIVLKFIFNTHHHFDHVGGNHDLKKKYNAKVIGFHEDKNRIPGIDICLKDKEIWKMNGIGEKGINQIRWDLIIEKNNSQKPYYIHFNKFISSGNYKLILKTENIILEEKITVNEFQNP